MKKIEYEWTKKEKEVNISAEEIADGIINSYVYENEDDICDDDISNYLIEEEISDATDEDFDKINALIRNKLNETLAEAKRTQKEYFRNRNSILALLSIFIEADDNEVWYLSPEEILNEILKNGNK